MFLFPSRSVRMRLSFPGQGQGAGAAMPLAGLGLSAPTRDGRSWEETSRSAGCRAGEGLLGSACPSWDPGGQGGLGGGLGSGCKQTQGGGAVSAPLRMVRQSPALPWQGKGTERRRGTMLSHGPGSPNLAILPLSIILTYLLFILHHKCSGFL